MQALLGQLNALPGVLGTLVCGPDGRLLANAFPPKFDQARLAGVAKTLADGAAGLGTVTGPVKMLDLRHGNARIVARPVRGAILLFLCAPSTSLQPLEISASIAGPKLERLIGAGAAAAGAPPEPVRAGAGGKLHALVLRVNQAIERKRLDPFTTRGEIALQAGFGLGFIDAATPDDPEKLAKLEAAATAVLGEAP